MRVAVRRLGENEILHAKASDFGKIEPVLGHVEIHNNVIHGPTANIVIVQIIKGLRIGFLIDERIRPAAKPDQVCAAVAKDSLASSLPKMTSWYSPPMFRRSRRSSPILSFSASMTLNSIADQ